MDITEMTDDQVVENVAREVVVDKARVRQILQTAGFFALQKHTEDLELQVAAIEDLPEPDHEERPAEFKPGSKPELDKKSKPPKPAAKKR